MTNRFIPIDFLNEEEKKMYKTAEIAIRNAKSLDELSFFESILDDLLETAIKNYKSKHSTGNKELVESH